MQNGIYKPPPGAYAAPGAPGPYGRNVPRYGHPGSGSKRSGACIFCKWYCCCFCCFFLTIVVLAATVCIAFLIVKPRFPKYDISNLDVSNFNITPDFDLKSHLVVTMKADNPNKYIEIIYGHAKKKEDNSIQMSYSNVTLCSGTFPEFTQPKNNVTMMKLDLKGDVKKDDWKQDSGKSLADKLKKNDKIALIIQIKFPMNAKFASRTLFKDQPFVFHSNCTMNVKNLGTGKKAEMTDIQCEYATYLDGKRFV